MKSLKDFKKELNNDLENGYGAVPLVLEKIESEKNVSYDEAKFSELMSKASTDIVSLNVGNYINQLRSFIVSIAEKRRKEYFEEGEIEDLKELEKDSLLIHIKSNSLIYLRPPGEKGIQYEITQQRFPERVTGILQRLLLEDSMRESEYEILGTSLFNRLFSDEEARKEFLRLIQDASKVKPLKIVLSCDVNSSKLACLPWEYLYYPVDDTNGNFLGAKEELIFTRRIFAAIQGAVNEITTPELRILIAISANLSKNGDEKEVAREYENEEIDENDCEEIKEAKEIKNGILSHNNSDDSPARRTSCTIKYFSALPALTDFIRMSGNEFHIVHFIGLLHSPEGKVALTDQFSIQENKVTWMSHEDFIKCFGEKKPGLIFLHAGKEKREEGYLCLSGLAFHLAKEIAGVLVIQAPAGGLNAVEFSKLIYEELIKEKRDLDMAFKYSLIRMAKENDKKNAVTAKTHGITAIFSREALRLDIVKDKKEKNIVITDDDSNEDYYDCQYKYEERTTKLTTRDCDEKFKLKRDGKTPDGFDRYKMIKVGNFCSRSGNPLKFCSKCGLVVFPKISDYCSNCGKEIDKDKGTEINKDIRTEVNKDVGTEISKDVNVGHRVSKPTDVKASDDRKFFIKPNGNK